MQIEQKYLDGEYLEKNPTFHVQDSPWKAQQILKGIRKAELEPESIAEIGCGAGEILVQLAGELPSASLTGYELSPQGFALCEDRGSERIRYFNSDPLEESGRFDLMLCMDVFEHIEDCFTFLRKLVAKADHFIFHIPLEMTAQMVVRASPMLRVRKKVGHIHYFSRTTALALLEDCGFDVVDWFYTQHGVERPKSSKAKLLQIPRKLAQMVSMEMTARILGGYSLLVVAKPREGAADEQ